MALREFDRAVTGLKYDITRQPLWLSDTLNFPKPLEHL